MMKISPHLDGINIELTTYCPLHCPQCYCPPEKRRMIPADIAQRRIREAYEMGVTHIEMSGGETLCYPNLKDLISEATKYGIRTSIAISGWNFDERMLNFLMDAGIDSIYVSLNGPTKETNELTRDGYDYAINALEILHNNHFPNTFINWVMHRNSVSLLPHMITLAEKYTVNGILIMEPKPTSSGDLHTYPTKEQLYQVASIVKQHKGSVQLIIQHCFSQLLALRCDNSLWGNRNRGLYKGCTAGLCSLTVNVDGDFSPCRHLYYSEKWNSMEEYWKKSKTLEHIRMLHEVKSDECSDCRLSKYCLRCISLNGEIYSDTGSKRMPCELYSKSLQMK